MQPGPATAELERPGRDDVGDPVPQRLLVYNVLDWFKGKLAAANRKLPASKLATEQEDTNGSSPR